MKITINAIDTGFSNNGGTKTLFHSANILTDMGHEVKCVSNHPNKFTWFPLKAEFIQTRHPLAYPDADANIATGFQSVKNVVAAPPQKGKAFHWIRAHETWITKSLGKIYNAPTVKWVNSEGLKFFIKREYNVDTELLYPGVDLDIFFNTNLRRYDLEYFTVGALNNKKPRKRQDWLVRAFDHLNRSYGARAAFLMFGNDGKPLDIRLLNAYIQQPSPAILRTVYNKVKVWLAPTYSEGLHICPMEAALCGCLVVGTTAELAGMRDWLVDGHSGFMSENDFGSFYAKIVEAVKCTSHKAMIIADTARNTIENVIGSRERNMKRMVELIEGAL